MAKAKKEKKVKPSAQDKALDQQKAAKAVLDTVLKSKGKDEAAKVAAETEQLQEALAEGSPLTIGMHLSHIRDIIAPSYGKKKSPTSADNKVWGAYMRSSLRGQTRQTSYNWINAYEEADKLYDRNFVREFAKAGYATGLRVSKEKPLGKFSDVAAKLAKAGSKQMSVEEAAKLVPVVVATQQVAGAKAHEPVTPSDIIESASESLVNAVKRTVKKQTGEDDPGQYREVLEAIVTKAMVELKVRTVIGAKPAQMPNLNKEVKSAISAVLKQTHTELPSEVIRQMTGAAVGAVG